MRRAVLFAAVLFPLAAHGVAARAQPAAAPAAPLSETVLHLSETAEVTRAPDELRATLRAEARGSSAAVAQEGVNRLIAAALERAEAVPAVRAATGGYWTWQTQQPPRAWQAGQTLTLRSGDGAALQELVGTLQAGGLGLTDLSWHLTRDTAREAREEASRLALEGLQRRAAAVAAQLGLEVVGLKEVRLDADGRSGPMPRMATMAMASAERAATPPSAVPDETVVSATAAAEVVLRRP